LTGKFGLAWLVDSLGGNSQQPEALGLEQQVPDGGGVPACSAPGRALSHRFELGGDLLQGAIGRGCLDPANQPHQPVVASLWTGTLKQSGIGEPFGNKPPHRPPQPLDRPGLRLTAIEDAHDIAPRLIGTHTPYRRQPSVQLGQDAVEVGDVAGLASVADRIGITGPETGVAADATAFAGGNEASLGTLRNQCPFELGDRSENLKGEHTLWGRGIDWIVQAAEVCAPGLKFLDHREQVADRARQAIEADHDQSVTAADLTNDATENRPVAVGA